MFLSLSKSSISHYFLYAVDLKGYKSLVNHIAFYLPLIDQHAFHTALDQQDRNMESSAFRMLRFLSWYL